MSRGQRARTARVIAKPSAAEQRVVSPARTRSVKRARVGEDKNAGTRSAEARGGGRGGGAVSRFSGAAGRTDSRPRRSSAAGTSLIDDPAPGRIRAAALRRLGARTYAPSATNEQRSDDSPAGEPHAARRGDQGETRGAAPSLLRSGCGSRRASRGRTQQQDVAIDVATDARPGPGSRADLPVATAVHRGTRATRRQTYRRHRRAGIEPQHTAAGSGTPSIARTGCLVAVAEGRTSRQCPEIDCAPRSTSLPGSPDSAGARRGEDGPRPPSGCFLPTGMPLAQFPQPVHQATGGWKTSPLWDRGRSRRWGSRSWHRGRDGSCLARLFGNSSRRGAGARELGGTTLVAAPGFKRARPRATLPRSSHGAVTASARTRS